MADRSGRAPREPLAPGEVLQVELAGIVHGGHCLAHARGRTLLVRHGLPGELVLARVTAVTSKVSRADAIEVLRASSMRVVPPCSLARPSGCGGCDFQHADLAYQRDLKSQVIADAFRRHARLDGISVEVEPLAAPGVAPGGTGATGGTGGTGGTEGLGWRTRMRWHGGADGALGLHAHRSAEVVPVERCLIADEAISTPPDAMPGSGAEVVRASVGSDGKVCVLAGETLVRGSRRSLQQVRQRTWRVDADTFWQAHPLAASALVDAVLQLGQPAAGECWWDLFAGAGLFSAFLGQAVGSAGTVSAVEGNPEAVRDARRSLHDLPQVRLHLAEVGGWLGNVDGRPDGVVLDPPRTGLGPIAMARLVAARPRVIVYVACDPVALARDVAAAAQAGYRLGEIRAFDAFPMTHHVETVAALVPEPRLDEIS